MKKIRNGFFETNSSSVHALIWPKEKKSDLKIPGKFIEFKEGTFGGSHIDSDLSDVEEKASYLFELCKYLENNMYENPEGVDYISRIEYMLGMQGIETFFNYNEDDNGFYDNRYGAKAILKKIFEGEETLLQYFADPNVTVRIRSDDFYGDPKTDVVKGIDKEKFECVVA